MEYEQIQLRRQSVLQLIKSKNVTTIEEIITQLNLSDSTVRRDIKWLEEKKEISRFHGGVSPVNNEYDVFEVRNKLFVEEKEIIANYAASFVENNDIIYIGGGSTMVRLAAALAKRTELSNVMVVTSTMNVAAMLAGRRKQFKVVVLGGELLYMDECIVSRSTLDATKQINYTKAFTGVHALTPTRGVNQVSPELAELNQILLECAKKNYLLTDHSKFGQIGPYNACKISDVDAVIVDRHPSVDKDMEGFDDMQRKIIQL
ncbi:MAG: DeoR/GlpR family DNA-binding transcription regulator [Oscillospiraceae bacterium]|nr:DeoR/GlpR family DNA-binding transcription regulator [Oscillospiraceae bacterium]